MGERAALMGGAYTALSEDVSGAYYNPAGLAFIKRSTFSMTTNLYSYTSAVLNVTTSGSSNFDVDFKKFNAVPGTLGVTGALSKRFKMALSVFQLDSLRLSSSILVQNNSLNTDIDIQSYLMGPSFAYRISDQFSIGLSVFYHLVQADVRRENNIIVTGGRQIDVSRINVTSGGITGVLGIKWYITSGWQLGLTYSPETINIHGSNTVTRSVLNTGTTPSAFFLQVERDGDIRLPHRIALGMAYGKKKGFTVSMDVIYYFSLDYPSKNDYLGSNSNIDRHLEDAHFDFSIGAEVFVSRKLAFRFGFFTNTSSAPDERESDRVNLFGFALGAGHVTNNLSTSLGLNFQSGSSSATPNQNGDPVSWKRFQVSLIVGSSIRF